MTDPSYAGQLITFTFPHIGNTGANTDDIETSQPFALGMIVRNDVTNPSNWRTTSSLQSFRAMRCPSIRAMAFVTCVRMSQSTERDYMMINYCLFYVA